MEEKVYPENEISVEDGDSYSYGSKGIDYKTIVMRQFQKCCDECSKELTKRGVINREINGNIYQFPVPDQIEIIINAIDTLKMLLTPKIKSNKEFIKDYFDSFDDDVKKVIEERDTALFNINKLYPINENVSNNAYNSIIVKRNQSINNIHTTYESKYLRLYKDKILVGISILLDKLNYFNEYRDT